MKQEIQGSEIGEFEALDRAETDAREVAFDTLGGDFANEQWVVLRLPRNKAYVHRIAFVAGSGVGKIDQFSLCHSMTSGCTSRLGMSAGQ